MKPWCVAVIRSGDYYMFEDDDEALDQLDELEEPSETEGKVGPLEVNVPPCSRRGACAWAASYLSPPVFPPLNTSHLDPRHAVLGMGQLSAILPRRQPADSLCFKEQCTLQTATK